MKLFCAFLLVLVFIIPHQLLAQDIIYSEFKSEDDRDISFNILGKMNDNYIIYKNIRWKHVLTSYDSKMNIIKNERIKFIPEKTFNIDFVTYPNHFYMIYQYKRSGVIYCMGVKMDAEGEKVGEPIQLDTTRVNLLEESKIYNTVYSQDKQKIMVYKMMKKNQQLTIATKLFNTDLTMLDSTRLVTKFDDRRDSYTDILLDNDGNIVFGKETREAYRGNVFGLDVFFRKPGTDNYKIVTLDLKDKNIDDPNISIDNLNKHYVVNSFYFTQQVGNIKGLNTVILDAVKMDTIRSVFNDLPDSLRYKFNAEGRQYKYSFDNLFVRQAIFKKDGGFLLTTEDYAFQNRSNPNSTWNRSLYPYSSPYTSASDFYLANPAYGYYRPLSSFNNWQTISYYYNNIFILSFDKDLKIEWNTVIPKTQTDDDNDNFLSFSTMNVGAEIHFLFNEVSRNRQLISNQSILPNGVIKRYPTLKSREAGYEFMPRLAKQIGYREVIVPCIYRSNIAFAKVSFPD